jgi:hypothetical protein
LFRNISTPRHRFRPFCFVSAFTDQYLQLNALKQKYLGELDIAAFPCNQFGLQEPGENHEILNGLRYVRPGDGFIPDFAVSGRKRERLRERERLDTEIEARERRERE